jgi:hypothetical protein
MADPVLAKPPSECCIANIIHKGEPRGSLEKIAEVETYVSRPAEGKWNSNVILYFPDVNGLFNNARLVMDGFAAAGYLTLGLDYFLGVSIFYYVTLRIGMDLLTWSGCDLEPQKKQRSQSRI